MNTHSKIRVAAYCRVSTDQIDQRNSLQNQKQYFEQCITHNPSWQLVNIYADEGVTGTSTNKRKAFLQMIDDAKNQLFDMVVTKEISRFARNTLDSILYTRKLKEYGIGVLFLQDNINTLDADAELRLTIMASIAQEESRKTSERVKWGQRRRMEQGAVFGRELLGYKLIDKKLRIVAAEAEVVRHIFRQFAYQNKSAYAIAKELDAKNIPTSKYMKKWSTTAILRILRNEKYCGDLVQGKTVTKDYLSHKKIKNIDENSLIIVPDSHEAIITRSLFKKVQQRLTSREAFTKKQVQTKYDFSGKIFCGNCGKNYVARRKKKEEGKMPIIRWRCYEAVKHGSKVDAHSEMGCNNKTIQESCLRKVVAFLLQSMDLSAIEYTEKVVEIYKQAKRKNRSVFMSATAKKKPFVEECIYETMRSIKKETFCFGPMIRRITVCATDGIFIEIEGIAQSFYCNGDGVYLCEEASNT